jgi:hypothetical protein
LLDILKVSPHVRDATFLAKGDDVEDQPEDGWFAFRALTRPAEDRRLARDLREFFEKIQ